MWCEKGYPEGYKRKLRGYGLGAAPPGCSRELIVCTFRKHGKLARTTSSALRPASAPSTLLLTLPRPFSEVTIADLHHTHHMHTLLAHLHAGMANALACTQHKSHGTRA